jgi:uncharacterized membrane protein
MASPRQSVELESPRTGDARRRAPSGRSSFGYQAEGLQPQWAIPTRLAVGGIGVLSLLGSSRLPGPIRAAARVLGVASLVRAATNLNVTEMVGWLSNPVLTVEQEIRIEASIDDVFDFLKDLSNFPRFMSYLEEVSLDDRGGHLWRAKAPGGVPVHWHTTLGRLTHNQAIAWRSARGSLIRNSGQFALEDEDCGCATRLRARMSFAPAIGAVGYGVARILGVAPGETMAEDLAVLKDLIERESRARA